MDWQNIIMVLGSAVMTRKTFEELLSVSCEAKYLYLSPGHVNILSSLCAKSMVY